MPNISKVFRTALQIWFDDNPSGHKPAITEDIEGDKLYIFCDICGERWHFDTSMVKFNPQTMQLFANDVTDTVGRVCRGEKLYQSISGTPWFKYPKTVFEARR